MGKSKAIFATRCITGVCRREIRLKERSGGKAKRPGDGAHVQEGVEHCRPASFSQNPLLIAWWAHGGRMVAEASIIGADLSILSGVVVCLVTVFFVALSSVVLSFCSRKGIFPGL